MKKLLILSILFSLGFSAFAQKVFFIYIQSEGNRPFYVKMGEKVYSSTSSGYLILSKLKDSTYSFYLGQPGNQAKELHYSVKLNNNDRGFLLKELQNNWVLFDLQSMITINPSESTSGVMYQTDVVKNDMFTRLLARAVDDSTLLLEPVLATKEDAKQNVSKSKTVSGAGNRKTDVKSNSIASGTKPEKEADSISGTSIDSNDIVAVQAVQTSDNGKESSSKETLIKDSLVQSKTDSDSLSQTDPANLTQTEPVLTSPVQTASVSSADTQSKTVSTTNNITQADSAQIQKPGTTPAQTDLVKTKPQDKPAELITDKDSATQVTLVEKTVSTASDAAQTEQVQYKRSLVKRYAESSNNQGFGLTFLDTWEGVTDTIRLVIPNVADPGFSVSAPPQSTEIKQDSSPSAQNQQDIVKAQSPGNTTTSSPVIENKAIENKGIDDKTSGEKAIEDKKTASNTSVCQVSASDKDVSKLRKSMSSKPRGEEMLAEARRAFEEKCFSTEQVRKLSELFFTSEGKFLFFKDAKAHISDKDRFETLIFEFNEENYKDRFKTLLEN